MEHMASPRCSEVPAGPQHVAKMGLVLSQGNRSEDAMACEKRLLPPFTEWLCCPGHSLPRNAAGQGPEARLRYSSCPFYLAGSFYLKAPQ